MTDFARIDMAYVEEYLVIAKEAKKLSEIAKDMNLCYIEEIVFGDEDHGTPAKLVYNWDYELWEVYINGEYFKTP